MVADRSTNSRRPLDVRENVRFRGGPLSRWVHAAFPGQACCLAVEVKKFFMDERTGELDEAVSAGVREALAATVPGVLDEIDRMQVVRSLSGSCGAPIYQLIQ